MSEPLLLALAAAVFVVAVLYASVGHGGATGYIAVMTLFGLAPEEIRPTALVLNVLVSSLATWQFARAGHFRWRLFAPLAVASVPAAVVGGSLALPTHLFEAIVAVVLIGSAWRILRRREAEVGDAMTVPHGRLFPLLAGGGLGLLSGLTGVGGGVFLTPLLLAIRAAAVKTVAATSAPFILVNSLAGLAGWLAAGNAIPSVAPLLLTAAALGGGIGGVLGATRIPSLALRRLMAVVLLIAGVKLLVPAAGWLAGGGS